MGLQDFVDQISAAAHLVHLESLDLRHSQLLIRWVIHGVDVGLEIRGYSITI